MSLFYSPSTGGFYFSHIHKEAQIPEDVVEISESIHQQLLEQQSQGLQITRGSNGLPQATNPETLLTLQDIKDRQTSLINSKRLDALSAGFVFEGVIYDADDQAKTNVTGVMASIVAGVSLSPDFTWRSKDNNNIPMDVSMFSQFAAAFMQNYQTIMKRSWLLKDLIKTRTTKAQVTKIDWNFPLEE